MVHPRRGELQWVVVPCAAPELERGAPCGSLQFRVEQGEQGELERRLADKGGTARGNGGEQQLVRGRPRSPCSTGPFPFGREILLVVPPVPPVPRPRGRL